MVLALLDKIWIEGKYGGPRHCESLNMRESMIDGSCNRREQGVLKTFARST